MTLSSYVTPAMTLQEVNVTDEASKLITHWINYSNHANPHLQNSRLTYYTFLMFDNINIFIILKGRYNI